MGISSITFQTVESAARHVARALRATGHRVVFAESCTGGLLCGALSKIPGISDHLCGGMVVYRNETKAEYLGISRKLLADPGPVSREVAEQMALGVLARTPEATIALSVTGHLGPNAPAALDGLVFVGLVFVSRAKRKPRAASVYELNCRQIAGRMARQRWVVQQVLQLLGEWLK
ncbi:MAG: nicotinamide-nucleotide amidohydrolase family protein [Pirellulaceae bacterium]